MNELKIVGWTYFEDSFPTKKVTTEELNKIIELIRNEIIEKGYVFSGEEHQNSSTGAPVLSDGTCFRASMRCWGTIMSTIYCAPDGSELSYMDFYMSLGDASIMPEESFIDVKPAVVDEESFGCTVAEDIQILDEARALGMPFMTTDKVLINFTE